jgi:protein-S-isoprenylcysteine O-methyltransferase Ste14
MRVFFVQPAGYTTGMKVITTLGAAFAVLHFTAIVSAHHVPVEWSVAAFVAYLGSLALYWWTVAVNRAQPLSAAFSPDVPRHLVQRGPYRLIRHPFYTSYLLMWLAGVPASGEWWLLATVAIMTGVYVRAALSEERKFSNSPFAGAYDEYRRRTGLLVPNPLKMRAASRSR